MRQFERAVLALLPYSMRGVARSGVPARLPTGTTSVVSNK